MTKKIFALLLVFAILCTTVFANAVIAETVASGTFWQIDTNGTLTILNNAPKDYSSETYVPWNSYMSSIKNISISPDVTKIPNYACKGNLNLKRIVIPDTVQVVGEGAFLDCTNLKHVVMGTGIQTFETQCFRNTRLSDISIPLSTITIGYYSFAWTPVSELNIPANVDNIAHEAFYGCDNLKTVRIWAENPAIGYRAFGYYGNLETVYLPETVSSISEIYYGFNMKELYYDGASVPYGGVGYITGTSYSGHVTAHYNYKDVNITNIDITEESLSLKVGENYALNKTITPNEALMKPVYWSSTDKSVAYVDSYGKVYAEKPGSATIIAEDATGNILDFCVIDVSERTNVTSIELDKSSMNIVKGDSAAITATVNPDNATEKNLVWSSGNTDIATVDSNGLVTAVSPGITKIRAESDYECIYAECEVVVDELVSVTGIAFTNSTESIKVNEEKDLNVIFTPSNSSHKALKWQSGNNNVVTVDNGKIKGIGAGTAIVIATSVDGGYKASCIVTVAESYDVTAINLNESNITLYENQDATLVATITPSNAKNKNIIWSSSNTDIATVESGEVTAKTEGTAEITATTEDGGFKATCRVIVLPIPVESIALNKSSITLNVGDAEQLNVVILPENAKNKNVVWYSSDSNVAMVNSGKILAVSPGRITVKAKTVDGNYEAKCDVVVLPINVSNVKISKNTLSIKKGATGNLSATVAPENATYKDIVWTSNDESIATVNNGTVTGVSEGTAVITAAAEYGDAMSYCVVTVTASYVTVNSITLNQSTLSVVEGYSESLTATVLPNDATNKKINWTSNNESIVTVNNGTITGVAPGTAVIVATTEDGGKFATCIVTVSAVMQEPVSTPLSSVLSGVVKENTNVILLTSTPNTTIYYTLDNTTPTRDSNKYTVPIKIEAATELKVLAVKAGMLDSNVASFSYTIADPDIPYVNVVTNVSANKGNTTNVSVNLSENSRSAGGSFNLVYDNTALELLSVENGSLINSANPIVNENYAENKIRVVWAGAREITNGGSILNVEFKILNSNKDVTYFNLEKAKIANSNAEKMSLQSNDGILAILNDQNTATYEYSTESIVNTNNTSIDVMVETSSEQDAVLITALYDTNNKLICFKTTNISNVNKTYNIDFERNIKTNEKIKVYAWQSLSSMQPLSGVENIEP